VKQAQEKFEGSRGDWFAGKRERAGCVGVKEVEVEEKLSRGHRNEGNLKAERRGKLGKTCWTTVVGVFDLSAIKLANKYICKHIFINLNLILIQCLL
jgi:hypothetical protein